jgi:predicted nucleotide-binding protein
MTAPAPISAATGSAPGRRVAVLGHPGDTTPSALAGYLIQLGLEPVSERLDGLRDVTYAIVMLSPGDPGPELLLDIGYLLAVVGRARICFVPSGQTTLPSDLEGITRHTMDDAGFWRLLLAREMRQAGLDVDLNRAI